MKNTHTQTTDCQYINFTDRTKVIVTATFLLFSLFMGLTSCKKEKEPTYKIGVSQCSSDEWREKMNQEMRRELMFHDDAMMEIKSAWDNNEQQIKDIEYFLDNDFDIIIVAPNEADALTPVVKKVFDSGVPVIIFDRRVRGEDYTAYIDLDNKGIGESAAEYAHSLGNPNQELQVIEITGLGGSTPAEERHAGFLEGIKRYPNMKLLASEDGQWDREKARILADSLLKIYPGLDVVYAHSDNMAIGISEVFKEAGREDIKILGTDASPDQGIKAIEEGVIQASFIYPTEGHRIIRTAFDILEEKPFQKTIHIPSLASVDKSNAEILLRQNELLKDETEKVLLLDDINDQLEKRHNTLTRYFNAVVTLAIVLALIFFLFILVFIHNRKLQKQLEEQNKRLIEEREQQIGLYKQLDNVLTQENDFYSRFISIIKADFGDSSLNTDSLAQKMAIGSAQLTRKIKSLTNYTPVEILRNYRLEQARNLVMNSDKSINEITYAVGFSSAPYLTKCFREHFGLTPSDLRANKN